MATGTLGGFLQRLCKAMAAETLASLSDRELIERFLASHDEVSFHALLRRHGSMVLRVCRRALSDERDVEDAFQATFLVLARNADAIRKRASLSSWLHGVAHRVALDARKANVRRRKHEAQAAARAVPLTDEVGWKELRAVLDEELIKLPDRLRAPLVLCYLEGLTQDEAAARLGRSKSTFRRNLERGRELLGVRLTRRGVTLSAALFTLLLSECAVPAALAASTTEAAVGLAAGKAVTALTSARALILTQGFVQPALSAKVKAVCVALAAVLAGFGGAAVPNENGPGVRSPVLRREPSQQLPAREKPVQTDRERIVEIKGQLHFPEAGQPPGGSVRVGGGFELQLFWLDWSEAEELRRQAKKLDGAEVVLTGRLKPPRSDYVALGYSGTVTVKTLQRVAPVSGRDPPQVDERKPAKRIEFRHPVLILHGEVQTELKLAREQVSKIRDVMRDVDARSNKEDVALANALQPGEPAEAAHRLIMERNKALREALPEILTDAQALRLRQLERQWAHMSAFQDSENVKLLGLTNEQRGKVRTIVAEAREFRPLVQDGRVIAFDYHEADKAAVQQILGLLTAEQKKTWRDITGEPFDVDSLRVSDLFPNLFPLARPLPPGRMRPPVLPPRPSDPDVERDR
jgi:RNA polymerase sigma factor (sigma-70 family)